MKKFLLSAVLIASAGLMHAQIGAGLVAHYEFQGNSLDWTNNQPAAVLNNTSYVTDRFGNPNSALRFGGQSSSYADCGNATSLQIQGDISISLWIRMESGNTHEGRIVSFEDENGNNSTGYFIGTNQDTAGWHITFGLGNWPLMNSWLQAGAVIQPNTWHHVAVVGDGSTMNIYFDGVFADGIFYTPSSNNFNTSLNLGRKSDTPNTPYMGAVDDVRIYSRALTLNEIQYLASYNPTGIRNELHKGAQFNAVPNPAKDLCTIQTNLEDEKLIEVQVLDVTGKPVPVKAILINGAAGVSVQLDIAGLEVGVYFVSISHGEVRMTVRIVKV